MLPNTVADRTRAVSISTRANQTLARLVTSLIVTSPLMSLLVWVVWPKYAWVA